MLKCRFKVTGIFILNNTNGKNELKKIFLKKNEERRIVNGHLWVFSNEIFKIEEEPESGDVAKVYDSKENLLGAGFFNKNSLIAVRMLSHSTIDDVEMFFREKIKQEYYYF